jgi:hypothetical protein
MIAFASGDVVFALDMLVITSGGDSAGRPHVDFATVFLL